MRVSRYARQGRPPLRQRQKGVVAILVGMTIVVMVGMVGLAIDLGQMYVSKSELQNGADACALAAAESMRSNLTSAESAGKLVAARHKVVFQGRTVGAQDGTITVDFSTDKASGPFQGKDALAGTPLTSIKFVRCQLSQAAISTFFIQALNALPGVVIGDQTVSALAVAQLRPSQELCALPVALCDADLETKSKGDWIFGVINDKDGDFLVDASHPSIIKWVDFSSPAGGASQVSKMITGDGECNVPSEGANIAEAGVKSSIATAYNSRFGIYTGNVSQASAPTDFSGHAYSPVNWTTKFNAYKDYEDNQLPNNTPYQGDDKISTTVKKLPVPPAFYVTTHGSSSGTDYKKGQQRRLMPAPVVTCDGSKTLKLKSWACIFMLHPISNSQKEPEPMYLEYRGPADAADSPCASNGLPGGVGSSGPLVAALVR